MINEIALSGFKSFFYKTLPLKKLTILTGLNSSGKSSFIQALLILEKAYKNENNVLLDGYGSIDEIKNTFYKEDISLSIINKANKSFQTVISKAFNTSYHTEGREGFDFPDLTYISAHRFGPKTSIPLYSDNFKKNRIGPNGENLLQCIEYYANEVLDISLKHENSEGETLLFNIRGWLSVISPNVKFDFKLDQMSDSSYSLFDEHRANNVGFGLSYSLPVIAALLVGTIVPNSLVIIENPEAHLHPKGQTEIARLISLCAQAGTQIIIETHSDHLFDGIRIAAKKTPNFAQDVQLHWFELNENKNTDIYSPILLEDGRVDEWPEGFFDQFETNALKLL